MINISLILILNSESFNPILTAPRYFLDLARSVELIEAAQLQQQPEQPPPQQQPEPLPQPLPQLPQQQLRTYAIATVVEDPELGQVGFSRHSFLKC